ncbi:hypothetical protein ASO20_00570 [Mycoplasma sp. (ex Biomphalaria glabrata)]|uniref:HU family DNA-binding protein n=1 Tax=Mycoplasma sp. (ex Biomphalaria glabrata) TaxID=1749074 RepID=UPI00073A7625|nr:HU family DNA-binding protein [Mycoplasma sp. (ex Biomphalaria glabrata)]ALV23170.1 hypothetical protein ASO20_00570 [Mycoplasma sp. (ex Biomphalaria glabrata)]
MKKIQTNQIIAEVAEATGLTKKDVKEVLDALENSVSKHLTEGSKVVFGGLGYFKTRRSAAREGINPLTQTKISIPSKIVPGFSFSKTIKTKLN